LKRSENINEKSEKRKIIEKGKREKNGKEGGKESKQKKGLNTKIPWKSLATF